MTCHRLWLAACLVLSCGCADRVGAARIAILDGTPDASLEGIGLLLIDYDPATDVAQDACGASLVGVRTMVTAGHCVLDEDVARMRVRFGSDGYLVERAESHPSIDRFERDIALLVLTEPPPVEPLTLSQRTPEIGTNVSLYGYGVSVIDDVSTAGTLRSIDTLIADVGSNYFEVRGAGRNSADGDSGAPVIIDVDGQPEIIGVISASTPDFERSFHVRIDTFGVWLSDEADEALYWGDGTTPLADGGTTPGPMGDSGCGVSGDGTSPLPGIVLGFALLLRKPRRR